MTDKLDNSAPFDDAQGTRIAGEPTGDDGQGTRTAREPTGAGAEAAEGIHGEPKDRESRRNPSDKTSLADRDSDSDDERKGSEPITSNSHEHRSGYGGNGGEPKRPNEAPKSR